MVDYMARQAGQGVAWPAIARHMLGLWHGTPGARRWRQVWSDHRLKAEPVQAVAARASQARRQDLRRAAPAEAGA
jgi:tRNA-dihydrouridine synthase A